jgi:negative regulator of genetic competence, sporulation and motility
MEAVLHVNATQTAAELSMFLTQSRIPRESGQEENDDDEEEEEEEGAGNEGKGSAEGQDEKDGKDEKEDEEDEEDEEDTEAAIILKEIQSRVDAAYAVTQEVRYVLYMCGLYSFCSDTDNNMKRRC